MMAIGVKAIGMMAIGMMVIVMMAIGTMAIGMMAIGMMAIGMMAIGMMAIGMMTTWHCVSVTQTSAGSLILLLSVKESQILTKLSYYPRATLVVYFRLIQNLLPPL